MRGQQNIKIDVVFLLL